MDAKCTTLPHQPVKEQVRFLSNTIIIDEELLKFVDNQQNSRHQVSAFFSETGNVLDPQVAEQFTSAFKFNINTLKNADAELPVTFNCNNPCVWQFVCCVRFEFNAFLEVDKIEFDFIGAVPQCKICDQHMKQRGFAGAGFACNERVLRSASSERQVL